MTVLEKRKPSTDLISLLNVAASGMLAFGELWDTVKKKGVEEGFDEKALLVLFAPMVKDKFTAAQVRYLMNKEKEQERARDNRQKQKEEIKTLRTYAHIPPKKEPEQSDRDWHYEQGEKEEEAEEKRLNEIKNSKGKDSEQFYKEQQKPFERTEALGQAEVTKEQLENEEPTELEFANIKIAQLEDALHKTEQFKSAIALEQSPKPITDYENTMDFLRKGSDGINTFFYDAYGIDLFKNRELAQLKNSGVKTFKRLYFEV